MEYTRGIKCEKLTIIVNFFALKCQSAANIQAGGTLKAIGPIERQKLPAEGFYRRFLMAVSSEGDQVICAWRV